MRFAIALLAATLSAQTTIQLHIHASVQRRQDTNIAFGRIKDHLAVHADVCELLPQSAKIPTARIRQDIALPAGYTLLPLAMAVNVVQAAQGRSPLSTTTRILSGVSAAGGAAVAVQGIPSGIASDIVLSVQGLSLLSQFIFPALASHAVLSIGTEMLPEMLNFDPSVDGGCAGGMVIIATPKKAKDVGILDQDVAVVVGGK